MDKYEKLESLLMSTSGSPKCYAYSKNKDDDKCFVWKELSCIPQRTSTGNVFFRSRIQIETYAKKKSDSKLLADEAVRVLDLNVTASEFNGCFLNNKWFVKDLETGFWSYVLDFDIWGF